jgi:hypothetical protein
MDCGFSRNIIDRIKSIIFEHPLENEKETYVENGNPIPRVLD